MQRGEFILNGTSSSELKSLIQYRPETPSPVRKVQMRTIPGMSGDYIFDEEAYENVPLTLELFTKGNSEEEMRQLRDKITYTFDSGGYMDFIPYFNPNMIYQIKTVQGPNYTPDGTVPLLLNYTVELTAKPFIYSTESIVRDASQSLTLNNPNYYESKPEITLYGTGNMKVHVNGKEFVFQEIDEHVVIDSETENAYKDELGGIISRNHRMFTIDFPVLQPGENTIEITGDATSFTVEPRWRKLVS